jgi:hypothetical protein
MLKTKNEIKDWLDKYKVTSYTINDDLTVDVMEQVKLSNMGLNEFPIQFGIVEKSFYCDNNNLSSLKGCPYKINGHFSCSRNNLISLDYAPLIIAGGFFCSDNPIISLKGFKTEIGSHIYQSINIKKMPKIKELAEHYREKHKTNNEIEIMLFNKDLKIILEHYLFNEEIKIESKSLADKEKKIKV